MTAGERAVVERTHEQLAGEGLRLLAVAVREGRDETDGSRASDERGWTLVGLLGFRDPLRAQVRGALDQCRSAGIAVKMITGDHARTATAIARDAGIATDAGAVVTGAELDALDDVALARAVKRASVFARIRPEQKYRIVDVLESAGETVAMTGDGINDAPALRRANIGIAMGQRGTDVARGAADLVLVHDDFGGIVEAVREGRRIVANVQSAFRYLIAFHVPIVGLALLAPMTGMTLILEPVHLVWLELIVHPVSALVFEAEPAPHDVMRRTPRARDAPLVARRAVAGSLLRGTLLTAATYMAFVFSRSDGSEVARAAAMCVLIPGSLFLVWTERVAGAVPRVAAIPSRARSWAVGGLVALSLPLAIYVPAFARMLHLGHPSVHRWLGSLALAVIFTLVLGVAGERALAGTRTTPSD